MCLVLSIIYICVTNTKQGPSFDRNISYSSIVFIEVLLSVVIDSICRLWSHKPSSVLRPVFKFSNTGLKSDKETWSIVVFLYLFLFFCCFLVECDSTISCQLFIRNWYIYILSLNEELTRKYGQSDMGRK